MDFNEHRKEQSLQKHGRFIYSEKVHLKALELLLFGFPEKVKLLDHFFQSYNKNYSFNIFGIPEVDEPSTSEYYDPRLQSGNMLTKTGQKRFKEEMKKQIMTQSKRGNSLKKGKNKSKHVSMTNELKEEFEHVTVTRTAMSSKPDQQERTPRLSHRTASTIS